jgi:transcriptional regulator with XRE-family HTH domain
MLGSYILESREAHGMLQKDLAKKLKMTGQFLGRIEKGAVGSPRDALIKTINILKLDAKKIIRIHVEAARLEALDLIGKARE